MQLSWCGFPSQPLVALPALAADVFGGSGGFRALVAFEAARVEGSWKVGARVSRSEVHKIWKPRRPPAALIWPLRLQ